MAEGTHPGPDVELQQPIARLLEVVGILAGRNLPLFPFGGVDDLRQVVVRGTFRDAALAEGDALGREEGGREGGRERQM